MSIRVVSDDVALHLMDSLVGLCMNAFLSFVLGCFFFFKQTDIQLGQKVVIEVQLVVVFQSRASLKKLIAIASFSFRSYSGRRWLKDGYCYDQPVIVFVTPSVN